jgi:hypothetical protein
LENIDLELDIAVDELENTLIELDNLDLDG